MGINLKFTLKPIPLPSKNSKKIGTEKELPLYYVITTKTKEST
jgi:hypothetical protein